MERLSVVRMLEKSDTGTNENLLAHMGTPFAARTKETPIVLRKVLLPAIFAPVTIAISFLFRTKLLATPTPLAKNG